MLLRLRSFFVLPTRNSIRQRGALEIGSPWIKPKITGTDPFREVIIDIVIHVFRVGKKISLYLEVWEVSRPGFWRI